MAEDLGRAVLELTTDNAPLNKGLGDGEVRVKQAVDVMQHLIDSVTRAWVDVGLAAKAAGDIEVREAERVRDALLAEAAAARLAGEEIAAARAKGGFPAGANVQPGAPGSRVLPSGGISGIWGVRGPAHPGSLTNPLVVVLEAAKYAPMGSMGAAIGSSNMADQQGNNSPVASALDLAALSDQVGELSRSMDSATRLAQAGGQGLAGPSFTPGGPSTVVQDPEGALLLEQAVQTLKQMQEGIARHPLVEKTQSGRVLSRAVVPGGQSGSLEEAIARQAAADALVEQARRDYQRSIRPGSNATAEQQTAALAQREAAVQEANAARAQSKAAQAEIAAAAAGGAGSGAGGAPRVALGVGGGSGGRDIGALLGTIMRGNGGNGGHFGLPAFGSVGSLAGLGLEHWLLTALGVTASAGSAVAGAGLLGTASLAQSAVGGGSDMLVSKDVLSQAQQMYQNVQALNKAIAVYGKGSRQAASAQYDLNQQWKALGGGVGKQAVQNLDKNALAVKKLFDTTSTGARLEAASIDEQVLTLAKTYTPLVTEAAQRNLGIINTGLKPLFAWLEGPQGIGIFHQLENAFARDLPTAVHAFDMGAEDFLRLMGTASQYTGGLAHWLDALFTKKNQESAAQYRAEVQKLVGDLHLWEALLKLLGEDLKAVFTADKGTAPAIVTSLTQMLQKLHDWEMSTSGQQHLQDIFAVHKTEILQLLHLIPELGAGFGSFYLTVAPPLVLALSGIAHGFNLVLTAVDSLGPAARDLLGLTIVLGKLGLLAPALRVFGSALGFDTAAEVENTPAAIADAAATRALAASQGGLGASGAAAAAAPSIAASEMSSGEMLGLLGVGSLGPKAALGDLAKSALPGLMAGGAGLLTAGMLQQALGLKGGTGATVGSGVVGGGIGFAVGGPLGAALGAGIAGTLGPSIGHLLGSIFGGGESYGHKFATGFGNEFDAYLAPRVKQTLAASTANAIDQAHAAAAQLPHPGRIPYGAANASGVHVTRGGAVPGSVETPAEVAAKNRAAGVAQAKQFIAGYQSVKFPSEYTFADTALAALQKMAPKYRQAATTQILQYANELTKSGQLPVGSVHKIIAAIEGQFPGLSEFIGKQGAAAGVRFKSLNTGMTQTLSSLQQNFRLFVHNPDVTGSNLFNAVEKYENRLQSVISTSSGQQRTSAINAYQQLRQQASRLFGSMLSDTIAKTGRMKDAVSTNTGLAARIGTSNFEALATNIANYINTGATATGKGLQNIVDQVNAALKGFGEKGLSAVQVQALKPGQLAAVISGQVSSGAAASPHAGGGLLQIGRPGQRGHDDVPLNVGGYPIRVGAGEKVAVFNGDQQAEMDAALAMRGYYGLDGLFSTVRRPHYMASGGFVPGFAAGGTLDFAQLEGLWEAGGGPAGVAPTAAAIALAESGGRDVVQQGQPFATTGWGYWQITPGGAQYLVPLTNAREAVAKYHGAGDTFQPWTTYNDGAYRAFLHGNVPAAAGGFSAPQIKAPGVGGSGPLSAIVGGALHKAAAAANAYLGRHAPSGGGSVPGGSFPSGGGFSPSQLGVFDGLKVADWIIPELAWARAHGWQGVVTSGWRSPSEVVSGVFATAPQGQSEHQYDIYPGGAVDVSDYQRFASIIAGYPGADKLIQLGIDPLHFSGTGHALGGLVGGGMLDYLGPAGLKDAITGRQIPASFLADAKKHKGSDAKPKPKPKHHGLTPPGYTPDKLVNGIMGRILGLDGLAGGASDIGNLNELMAYKEGLWGLDALNYSSAPSDFVVTQDALGNPIAPYIDQAALHEALGELMQILGWQGRIVHDLKAALALSRRVIPIIKRAIKKRQDEIEQTKTLIRNNLGAINGTTAQITAEKKKKHPDKKQLGAWNAYRSQLEAHNMQLGGSRTTLGSGGYVGTLQNELGTLRTNLSAASSWPYTIAGGTGMGGDLGPAILAYDTTEQQIDALKPGAGTALTVAQAQFTPATSSTDAQLLSLVEQQLAQQVETNTVLQDQYGALAAMPEFGGSFAQGGMVPGPVGAARTVIAHGGEIITPVGQGSGTAVHLSFAPGMEWLKDCIRAEIHKDGRVVARKVGRKMPGRAGLLVAG